jgi:hypothetical protein|tara:strand:+ start:300 stop:539 length:240 start_codon:yes stop_codon:yes gene_type:complete
MQFEIRAGLPEETHAPEGNYYEGEDAAVVTHCRVPECGLRFWHWITTENKIKTLVSADDTNHHNLRSWAITVPLTEGDE